MQSYEDAARLQLLAPELFDLNRESASVKSLYGLEADETRDFGTRCLIARRMLERDVRFIQIWSGAGGPKNNWDNHSQHSYGSYHGLQDRLTNPSQVSSRI